jgi:hypothetical protein
VDVLGGGVLGQDLEVPNTYVNMEYIENIYKVYM